MLAEPVVGIADRVVIVDDVITKGSTALAAGSRLAEVYPNVDIKVFALVRTKGLVPDIQQILDPATGIVRLVGDEGDRQP
jgi:adenine/guanine phosphoribosyltransferase-like PRPP-binding protein